MSGLVGMNGIQRKDSIWENAVCCFIGFGIGRVGCERIRPYGSYKWTVDGHSVLPIK